MKVLITGDWHLTDVTPRSRKDDYWETMKRKVRFIFDVAQKNRCSHILQPGDLFDSHRPSFRVVNFLQNMLKKHTNIEFHTIYGQHDMRYREKDPQLLPHGLLELYDSGSILVNATYILWVAHYGRCVPKAPGGGVNILLVHKMIIPKQELPWQEKFITCKEFINDHSIFDLIVSGDNHESFHEKWKDKHLFNCGSLMRSRSDQKDHKPVCYVFDLNSKTYTEHLIPIEQDVFVAETKKEVSKDLQSFTDNLQSNFVLGKTFEENVDEAVKSAELGVKDKITEYMRLAK